MSGVVVGAGLSFPGANEVDVVVVLFEGHHVTSHAAVEVEALAMVTTPSSECVALRGLSVGVRTHPIQARG